MKGEKKPQRFSYLPFLTDIVRKWLCFRNLNPQINCQCNATLEGECNFYSARGLCCKNYHYKCEKLKPLSLTIEYCLSPGVEEGRGHPRMDLLAGNEVVYR